MDNNEKNSRDDYTIDVAYIAKTLWQRMWIIPVVGFLTALLGFSWAAFLIKPSYSSSVMLYVNNSPSGTTAAQNLVKTYNEILNIRTTLERIIEKAGVDYTYGELSRMITVAPSDGVGFVRVTVVAHNPYEAAEIANCIAEVLPVRVSQTIDGASMKVAEDAIPQLKKIGPSNSKCTLVGLLVGAFGAAAVLVVIAMRDDTVHDEEYVLRTYDYPILAKVPNLLSTGTKHYAYYAQKQKQTNG